MKAYSTLTIALIAAASIFSYTAPATADVLSGWDLAGVDVADGTGIDSGSSPYPFTSTNTGANVGSAVLSLSASVNPSTSNDKYGFKVSAGDEETTLSGAISAGHYFEFTISAASGYLLNLTDIEMNGEATSTGADDAAIFSNIDGFTAGNELDSVTGIAGATGGLDTDSSGWGSPIDLSGAQYQGITGATFRVYGYNTTSGSGSTRMRSLSGDDLIINGTTSVIPEPASMALFLIGLGTFFGIRRHVRS